MKRVSKYKLSFKTQDVSNTKAEIPIEYDEFKELIDYIEVFMVAQGYVRKAMANSNSSSRSIRYEHPVYNTRVMVWIPSKRIMKTKIDSVNYMFFSKKELKFFDSLDFNITSSQASETKQEITDWWNMQ